MEVRNPLVGIDHSQVRTVFNSRSDGCFHRPLLGMARYLCVNIAQTIAGIHTEFIEKVSICFKYFLEINLNNGTKDDGVRSEERSVGNKCVSRGRSRWSAYN